jgi:hypothetical protein
LRRGVEQPLGAPARIGGIGCTQGQVRGADHPKSIP